MSLHDAGILSRSHIQEAWQYQGLVDFKLVPSLIPFRSQIFAQSSECHICFCNSGSDVIINVHFSAEFIIINNYQQLSIYIEMEIALSNDRLYLFDEKWNTLLQALS